MNTLAQTYLHAIAQIDRFQAKSLSAGVPMNLRGTTERCVNLLL
jgi:hypothetical protein